MNVIRSIEAVPQARSYRVGGTLVQMVNWMNYEGWEVRRADGDMPLGFVHEHEIGPIRKWVAEGRRLVVDPRQVTWDTLDEALAYLVGRSK